MPRNPIDPATGTRILDAPVVGLSLPAAVVTGLRTGGQGGAGAFIVQGLVEFGLHLTAGQQSWLTVAVGGVIAVGQNLLEQRAGRQLVGRARPATS
jgi:hypothetical protein